MSRFNYVTLLISLVSIGTVNAQRTISAKVVEKGTGVVIPETNVRLENASVGTVTDDRGRFVFTVTDSQVDSNLVISHVGYQTKKILVSQLSSEIQLEEQVYQIGEVTIRYVNLRKLLIKKWKVDENSIDKVAEKTLNSIKTKDPAKYEKLAKKPDTMKEAVKLIRLIFYEDGTAKVKALILLGKSYNWQLNDDDRTIIITDKEGNERTQTITELTDKHLVLRTVNKDGVTSDTGYVAVN